MYSKLKKLLAYAEDITGYNSENPKGEITGVGMSKWGDGKIHCTISGKTRNGNEFEIVLAVSECQKSE